MEIVSPKGGIMDEAEINRNDGVEKRMTPWNFHALWTP
jgi:hypothetical protein